MKRMIFLILCLMGIAITTNAEVTTYRSEERNVGRFNGIKASMGIDVRITQGHDHSVTVETDDELLIERTQTYVENGILHIKFSVKLSDNSFKGHHVVYVRVPELTEITAAMGASVKIKGRYKADHIKLTAKMGSDIDGIINARTIEAYAKMGSEIDLEGKADVCVAKVSGGSDISMKDLRCREADVKASSGANLSVLVTGKLDANASGGSYITYYGDPKIKNIRSSASSDIYRGADR